MVGDYAGNSGRDQISASAMSLGANFQVLSGDDRATILQLRGGLTSVKIDDYFTSNFPTPSAGSDSWHQTGIYFGLGIGRKLTQGLSVILSYSHYSAPDNANHLGTDLNLNWLGLVAEYQF
jgi:opacity protein-like surface antigen